MLANSIKFLAVGASLAGLVACGKGVGEKNNLKIDGTYTQEDVSTQGKDVKSSEETSNLTLISIDDNIMTTYKFSQDKKGVEVSKKRLIVKGIKIVGTEDIENLCVDESELGVKATDIKLKVSSGNLTLTESGTQAQEKGANVLLNTDLKAIKKDEFNSLLELAKTTDRVCLDSSGNIDVEKSAALKGKKGIDSAEAEKLAKADAEKEAKAAIEAEAAAAEAALKAEEEKKTEEGTDAKDTTENETSDDNKTATTNTSNAATATSQAVPKDVTTPSAAAPIDAKDEVAL